MDVIARVFTEAWGLLLESSVYILFGLLVSGLLRVFLNPRTVVNHLGKGRFLSVFKAALLGIPIPLCSCGVLPAAAALKKQGANNGATTAFLISTPESGVDSISITYALLDPIMTVVRPAAAFLTAFAAGIAENLIGGGKSSAVEKPDLSCVIDGCCDGIDCPPKKHAKHHGFGEKLKAGLKFAVTDVWADLAFWFFIGLLLAGAITAFFPDDLMSRYLGPGLGSMLLMLAIGVPMYICATASTPVAAALILKGASPGAALVFLLAGPATNMTSLTVLAGILGKRATGLYISAIAVSCVVFGLATDHLYAFLGVSAQAIVGQASEIFPFYMELTGALIVIVLSIKPVSHKVRNLIGKGRIGTGAGKKAISNSQKSVAPLESCGGST